MLGSSEEIKKQISNEISEAMSGSGDCNGFTVDEVDLINGTVTVQFKLHIVPEDDYVGLFIY